MTIAIEVVKFLLPIVVPLLAFAYGYGKLVARMASVENLINLKLGQQDNKVQKDITKLDKQLTKGITDLSERVVVVETRLEEE